jgi:hypothetical protein
MRTSRASSISCAVEIVLPKKSRARSGRWCASSKITVLAAGSRSAAPPSRNATSAKNRWWFTTITSASAARLRAFMTKHSW